MTTADLRALVPSAAATPGLPPRCTACTCPVRRRHQIADELAESWALTVSGSARFDLEIRGLRIALELGGRCFDCAVQAAQDIEAARRASR